MSTFSKLSRFFGKGRVSRSGRGFTLIELLAVTAIIVIITSVLLLRQSKFDSSTLLRSLAYSVALSIRQAQVYGTSVFGVSSSGSETFASGYGLYFSSGTSGSYILFADLNNDGRYDSSPTDESVKVFSLGPGYTLTEFCAVQGGIKACSGPDDTSGSPLTYLNIVFRRPDPDACFATNAFPTACVKGGSAPYSSAYIQVSSADGTTRSVFISTTGEIAVQAPGTLP